MSRPFPTSIPFNNLARLPINALETVEKQNPVKRLMVRILQLLLCSQNYIHFRYPFRGTIYA